MASLTYVDRSTKKLLQEKLNATKPTLKLISTFPIMPYTTNRQLRVNGHFKSVRSSQRQLYKTATPTR